MHYPKTRDGARSRSTVNTGALLLSIAAGYGAAFYAMWGVLLRLFPGDSLHDVYKNYYLTDQYTYLAISQNVAAGRSSTVEPLTASGTSLYPSVYYELLGHLAAWLGASVIFVWNCLGMIVTVALMVSIGALAAWLCHSRWGYLVGPLPFLVATLQWYVDGSYMSHHGSAHAVIWPPMSILFIPGAEAASFTMAFVAVLLLCRALSGDIWRYRLVLPLLSGALVGLILLTHTYVGLFTVMLMALLLVFKQLHVSSTREVALASALVAAAFGIATGPFIEMELGRYVVLMAGIVAPLLALPRWRRTLGWEVIALYGGAIAVFSPLALRIIKDLRSENSFFSFRQADAAGRDLGLPLLDVVFQSAPVLALAAFALWRLGRSRNTRIVLWRAALSSCLATSALLIFNNHWGLAQEPYRFHPYALIAVITLAGPALFLRTNTRTLAIGRVLTALALLATVPTTISFQQTLRDSTLHITKTERDALAAVAEHVDNSAITAVDSCIDRRVVATVADINVNDYNVGLGIPPEREAIDAVDREMRERGAPTPATLRAAGITKLLTKSSCPLALEWQAAYGRPTYTTPTGLSAAGPLSGIFVPGEHYHVYSI